MGTAPLANRRRRDDLSPPPHVAVPSPAEQLLHAGDWNPVDDVREKTYGRWNGTRTRFDDQEFASAIRLAFEREERSEGEEEALRALDKGQSGEEVGEVKDRGWSCREDEVGDLLPVLSQSEEEVNWCTGAEREKWR